MVCKRFTSHQPLLSLPKITNVAVCALVPASLLSSPPSPPPPPLLLHSVHLRWCWKTTAILAASIPVPSRYSFHANSERLTLALSMLIWELWPRAIYGLPSLSELHNIISGHNESTVGVHRCCFVMHDSTNWITGVFHHCFSFMTSLGDSVHVLWTYICTYSAGVMLQSCAHALD